MRSIRSWCVSRTGHGHEWWLLSCGGMRCISRLAAPAVAPPLCWRCWPAPPVTQTAGWCAARVAWLLGNTCHTECSCLRQIWADGSKPRSLSHTRLPSQVCWCRRNKRPPSIYPQERLVQQHCSVIIVISTHCTHFVGYLKSKLAMRRLNLWVMLFSELAADSVRFVQTEISFWVAETEMDFFCPGNQTRETRVMWICDCPSLKGQSSLWAFWVQ